VIYDAAIRAAVTAGTPVDAPGRADRTGLFNEMLTDSIEMK